MHTRTHIQCVTYHKFYLGQQQLNHELYYVLITAIHTYIYDGIHTYNHGCKSAEDKCSMNYSADSYCRIRAYTYVCIYLFE